MFYGSPVLRAFKQRRGYSLSIVGAPFTHVPQEILDAQTEISDKTRETTFYEAGTILLWVSKYYRQEQESVYIAVHQNRVNQLDGLRRLLPKRWIASLNAGNRKTVR